MIIIKYTAVQMANGTRNISATKHKQFDNEMYWSLTVYITVRNIEKIHLGKLIFVDSAVCF